MPTLLLLSMKRSGTNYFMDVNGRLPNTLCLRELFNPEGAFGIATRGGVVEKALIQAMGKDTIDERDDDVISFVNSDAGRAVDLAQTAAEQAGFGWLGLTVFDTQLDQSNLSALMQRPDTFVVVLKRKTLPRAISLKKARVARAWKAVDTTDVNPEISLSEIASEHERAVSWYALLDTLLEEHRPNVVRLTYEAHMTKGPEHLLSVLAQHHPGFPWRAGQPVPETKFNIQDRQEIVFDRVANGAALCDAALMDTDIAATFDYPGASG